MPPHSLLTTEEHQNHKDPFSTYTYPTCAGMHPHQAPRINGLLSDPLPPNSPWRITDLTESPLLRVIDLFLNNVEKERKGQEFLQYIKVLKRKDAQVHFFLDKLICPYKSVSVTHRIVHCMQ